MVELRVLGDVEAWIEDRRIEIGHARQLCVLAVLVMEVNRTVTADQLLERAWSGHPPHRGRQVLRTYLSRLRTSLAPAGLTIERRPAGYVLPADQDVVDVHRFHRLVAHARTADDEQAIGLFDEALALWRGEPFAGLDTPWLAAVRTSLCAERMAARLDHLDVSLRCGRHARLVPELSALAAEMPLDERVAGMLMLALYRVGRQSDALAHYQLVRRHLAEELGTDPGQELVRLHQRILTADAGLSPVAPTGAAGTSVVPRQLPAAPWAFAGRTDHLATLTAALDQRGPLVISAIRGSGGIGKTWLALAWAHRHLDRFPDGQLFVDLRGFSPGSDPVAPAVAVRGFLDALGVGTADIPADPQARSALLRSLVAHKRMLILLDNAADAEQVTPLLPGGDSCTVVITSRKTLTGVIIRHGAHHLTLGTLDDDESRALLTLRLGEARVEAEPEAVAELIRLCAGLPLALGIIAGRAHSQPEVPLSGFAADLRGQGVSALEDDDPGTGLPAVLSWSYQALTAEQQRVFGLLGIAPGPDIGLPAAASLTGLPADRTRRVLHALEEASLLRRDAPDRYSMHDLIRHYATDIAHEQLSGNVRQVALERVVSFYLHTAHTARHLIEPHALMIPPEPLAPGVHPQPLPDQTAAWDWLDTEHRNLLATQRMAADRHHDHAVWHLAWSLSAFHWRGGQLQENLQVWQAALDAHLEDATLRIHTHRHLGRAHFRLDQHEDAIDQLHQALTLAEHHQDLHLQALTHGDLAGAWERRGSDRKALDHARHALELHRTLGDPVREALVLNGVGWFAARLGEYDTAREHCQAALTLHRRHHNPDGEAGTLDSLGFIEHRTGHHDQAIRHYRQALALYRTLGDSYEVANTLDRIGHPHVALGQPAEARAAWQETLELYLDQGREEDAAQVQRQLDDLEPHGAGGAAQV